MENGNGDEDGGRFRERRTKNGERRTVPVTRIEDGDGDGDGGQFRGRGWRMVEETGTENRAENEDGGRLR